MDIFKSLQEIDSTLEAARNHKILRNHASAVRSVIWCLEKCTTLMQMDQLSAEQRTDIAAKLHLCNVELSGFIDANSANAQAISKQPSRGIKPQDMVLSPSQDLRLADLVGVTKAKLALLEAIILPNLMESTYELDMKLNGVLLFGVTGVGKSTIVRAVVNECSMILQKLLHAPVTFFNVTMSDILGSYHGETEKNLTHLFNQANAKQPSVILIDEIDSLTMKRSATERDSTRKIKNHLLSLMDGLAGRSRITVVGTTNRADEMDEGFIRRFDRRCYIPLPNIAERENLLRRFVSSLQIDDGSIDFKEYADFTYSFSPSDLKNLVKLAYHKAHWKDIADEMLKQLEVEGTLDDKITIPPTAERKITNVDMDAAQRTIRATNSSEAVFKMDLFAKAYATDYDDPFEFPDDDSCSISDCKTDPLKSTGRFLCDVINLLFV